MTPAADGAPAALCIERAGRADVAALLALYVAAGIAGEADYDLAQGEAQLARFDAYPFYRLFVARRAGRVVGTYEFLEMENMAKAGAKTAIVEDVAVAPSEQGNGIGRALMQHARALAERRGCYKLMLSSNARRAGAHAFYEALGFARHGISFSIDPAARAADEPR